jgi:prepilin peptidase CpaA
VIEALSLIFAGLLVACAVTDILHLRIPNVLVVALAVAFVAACIAMPPKSLLFGHVVPAAGVFVLTFGLFALGKFGGGDVKLLTVTVLWTGMAHLGPFLIALALYGAVAVLVFAVFRTQVTAALAWTSTQIGRAVPVPASLETGKSIPYGVVIAAAALSIGPGVLGGVS